MSGWAVEHLLTKAIRLEPGADGQQAVVAAEEVVAFVAVELDLERLLDLEPSLASFATSQ